MKKTLFLLLALTSGIMLSVGCGGPEIADPEEAESGMDETMNMDTMGETEGTGGADAGGGDADGGDADGGDDAASADAAGTE